MTFDDAMESDSWVSRKLALAEVRNHGIPVEDFLTECGDREQYSTREVLIWLGY